MSLDHEKGGDVAANLEQLYDYMTRRLLEASTTKNADLLTDVTDLIKEIKLAWDEIPVDLHHASE